MQIKESFLFSLLRFLFGFIFLWAGLDKLIGLGFNTCKIAGETAYLCSSSLLKGGAVTAGYLGSSYGPFSQYFLKLVGQHWVNWTFVALLLIAGLTLVFNKYVKIGAWVGALLVIMMYLSHFPSKENPVVDYHLIYFVILVILAKRG